MITINNNEYQYIENITVYDFIRKHNIFMPYFDENYQKVVTKACILVTKVET